MIDIIQNSYVLAFPFFTFALFGFFTYSGGDDWLGIAGCLFIALVVGAIDYNFLEELSFWPKALVSVVVNGLIMAVIYKLTHGDE